MSESNGITYDDAAVLFRAADLPSSLRHVRTMIWNTRDARGRLVCPVLTLGYHTKRLNPNNVARLVALLQKSKPATDKVYPEKSRTVRGAKL